MTNSYEDEFFSEEQLRFAARQVRESLLASLPSPTECDHTFSDAFCKKMDALITKERLQRSRKKVLQRVAAILLMFALGSGVWLTVDAEAREAFFAWVREVYENSIVYRFFGSEAGDLDELPLYSPSWLPEEYSEVDVFQDKDTFSALYQKGDDLLSGIGFAYYTNDPDANWYASMLPESDAYVIESLQINGQLADLCICTDGSEPNSLIWMSKDQSIVFELNGFIDKQEMLHIAESVVLDDLTK